MEQTMAASRAQGLPPGSQFGKYNILEHIGRGGMGDVYKAVQMGLERVVALKVLPHLLARSPEFGERFNAEAQAISRLQHHNIVTLYDYGEIDGQKYIAMQFIQGTTLSRVIQREKPLPYARIIAIAKQIGRGLKYAHAAEIVHRDIKSGNIMIESGDKIFISDFGIAKVIDAPSITTTGMALGTPEYMAPEQCEGGIVDGQSDLYGLGVILWEMVAGRPPFTADTPLAVAYKQVNEQAPMLSKIRPDIPKRLELIVTKLLKKNKLERYRNADEVLRDLDSVHLEVEQPEPPADTRPNQRITDRRGLDRRRGPGLEELAPRGLLIGAAVFLLAVLVLQGWQIWAQSKNKRDQYHEIKPEFMAGTAFTHETEGEMRAEEMFDGKLSTAYGIPPRGDSEVSVEFEETVLLRDVVLEAGLRPADGAGAMPAPKSITVTSDRGGSERFVPKSGEAPQVYEIGLVGKRFSLRFETGTIPAALREMRFYGLTYATHEEPELR